MPVRVLARSSDVLEAGEFEENCRVSSQSKKNPTRGKKGEQDYACLMGLRGRVDSGEVRWPG